jgi:hypothetical protein
MMVGTFCDRTIVCRRNAVFGDPKLFWKIEEVFGFMIDLVGFDKLRFHEYSWDVRFYSQLFSKSGNIIGTLGDLVPVTCELHVLYIKNNDLKVRF